jgi:hypothetical protein
MPRKKAETKPKVHLISVPGENQVGTKRFCLLSAAAERAGDAFKQGFYLEAITLTESLLATRLESRLTYIRRLQKKSEETGFGTLGPLCKELLRDEARVAPDWDDFQVPIQAISEWANQRNEALHEMAKLVEEDGHDFNEKYGRCCGIALRGFQALLAYDAVDRKARLKVNKYTATDNLNGATAFDCLRNLR